MIRIKKLFNKKLSPVLVFSTIILSFVLALGINLAFAWTSPGSDPPSGNVAAPINVSGTAQTKSGDLTVGNNSGIDLTVQEGLKVNGDITLENDRDIYGADIIQGYDDLRLWGNAAGTAPVYVQGDFTATGKIQNYGTAVYGQGMSTYVMNTRYWYPADNNSTQIMYAGINNPIIVRGDIRAPIYYDYNNTGYYVNPNETSKLNNIQVTGDLVANNNSKGSCFQGGWLAMTGANVYCTGAYFMTGIQFHTDSIKFRIRCCKL